MLFKSALVSVLYFSVGLCWWVHWVTINTLYFKSAFITLYFKSTYLKILHLCQHGARGDWLIHAGSFSRRFSAFPGYGNRSKKKSVSQAVWSDDLQDENFPPFAGGLDFILSRLCLSRQEQWATLSTYACWKHLLGITRKESQNHNIISEIYSNQMVHRLQEVMDNSQRIFRKVSSFMCLHPALSFVCGNASQKQTKHDGWNQGRIRHLRRRKSVLSAGIKPFLRYLWKHIRKEDSVSEIEAS